MLAALLSACSGKSVAPPGALPQPPTTLTSQTAAVGAETESGENWPMYGRNLGHTFSNPHSRINPSNVNKLKRAWIFPTDDAVSASPTVVDGVIYVGSWDGNFYAIRARTGTLLWRFQVDCQNAIVPVPRRCLPLGTPPPPRFLTSGGLITSSAAVMDDRVYFAGGRTLYSLNAKNGSLRWKRVICGNPEDANCSSRTDDPVKIFSSPAVFQGLIFIGHTADGHVGYRGGFEAIDASTGELRWRFELDPLRRSNRGCGNVWSSAAVDVEAHLVFFGTSDCNNDATPPYHEAVIALEVGTGSVRWVYRPRQSDTCDFDFGASPNLIDFAGGHYLGEGGKDGTYYLLNRRTGALVWARNVVFGGSLGGFYGASFDGAHIFAATSLGDGNIITRTGLCDPSNGRDTFVQEPSMHALDVSNGRIRWERLQNHSVTPTSLANGVVFSGLIGIEGFGLKAYDARTGEQLMRIPIPGSVNSAATPLGDMLFVTAGDSTDGKDSGVFAFTLPCAFERHERLVSSSSTTC